MDREQLFTQIAAATLAAWLAAFGKVLRRNAEERRKIDWPGVLLETPSAIVAGLMGGGLAIAIGHAHPLTIAGAGAIAGHLGAPLITQIAMTFWRRLLPQQRKD